MNLGLRYDLFQRHHEEGNVATTFILGPSTANAIILGPSNGLLNRVYNANIPAGTAGLRYHPAQIGNSLGPLAGVCGPGGFAPSATLGAGDHNNFGPRLGFAWDVFGDGKTSLRGGFGVAYEGTLYNPLSNSRWNLPYYSFNEAIGGVGVQGADIVYGPTHLRSAGGVCHQAHKRSGHLHWPADRTPATGTLQPSSEPRQHRWLGSQQPERGQPDRHRFADSASAILTSTTSTSTSSAKIMPKTVVDIKYVGTAGHKLFRSEDINRQPGLPAASVRRSSRRQLRPNVDRPYDPVFKPGGRLNPNYLKLRTWENSVNSNYNSLQGSLKHQMSHGCCSTLDYTYSHSIDNGSTWHSGATTANGAAAGEGYTSDQTLPGSGSRRLDLRHPASSGCELRLAVAGSESARVRAVRSLVAGA